MTSHQEPKLGAQKLVTPDSSFEVLTDQRHKAPDDGHVLEDGTLFRLRGLSRFGRCRLRFGLAREILESAIPQIET
jgi:hypothetical protein